jgi:hypothetical protein
VRFRLFLHVSFFLIVLFSGTVWQSSVVFDFLFHQEEIISEKCINKDNPEVHCHGACYLNKQLAIVEIVVPVDVKVSTVSLDFWLLSYIDKYQVSLIEVFEVNLQVINNSKTDLARGQLVDVFHPPQLI